MTQVRRIPDFPGYGVTTDGRVWSFISNKWMTPKKGRRGLRLSLVNELGETKEKYIHVLILETYVEARPAGCEALHEDDNPENNTLGNLSWGTKSDNVKDRMYNNGRIASITMSTDEIDHIRELRSKGMPISTIARKIGRNVKTVSNLLSGKTYSWYK